MKTKCVTLILLLLLSLQLMAITIDDIRFCLDREFFDVLEKHQDKIEILIDSADLSKEDWDVLLEYARRSNPSGSSQSNLYRSRITSRQELSIHDRFLLRVYWERAKRLKSVDDAAKWIKLRKESVAIPPIPDVADQEGLQRFYIQHRAAIEEYAQYENLCNELRRGFPDPADQLVINSHYGYDSDAAILSGIERLSQYNDYIENYAKLRIDELAIEPSDSLALGMINSFYSDFPYSRWHQAAYYFQLHHQSTAQRYSEMIELIEQNYARSPQHAYASAIYLASPAFRNALPDPKLNLIILTQAFDLLNSTITDEDSYQLVYDTFPKSHWQNKVKLQQAKIAFYLELDRLQHIGDEEELIALFPADDDHIGLLLKLFEDIGFAHNDRGELAELHFWQAKTLALLDDPAYWEASAQAFAKCLIAGAPRSRFDEDAWDYILNLHRRIGVKTDPMTWIRALMGYRGIVFTDSTEAAGLSTLNASRIAIADYDNDGWHDLLFSGKHLYKNLQDGSFGQVTTSPLLDDLPTNGGLWADFNRDGRLDFVVLTNDESRGEQLMKNQGDGSFVAVNDRAGAVFDTRPTEGAAWIDTEMSGYPSLYLANYEKWQVQSGYPDAFWQNNGGYFSDRPQAQGFHSQYYHNSPGLAGRGVAPADMDGDGIQEIYVTNYRLARNYLWKKVGERWIDIAALYGIQGKWKDGYYGHSIGADWADYDNDGDLDLFVANLAHPRYIDISDISILYRNDGMMYRVVEADTLYYWQFTDVTKEAGIKYDELHSDPLWFDADNDGDLDLYITSVYPDARSYLYENLGDGSFRDVTWLSGASVYNGWGVAYGDLNRDDLPDLVVGSGSGVKVLLNSTPTDNIALWIKPIWDKGEILYLTNYRHHSASPNSPAFGARYSFDLQRADGSIYSLTRELSGGKGTSSQNAPELHFGIGKDILLDIRRIANESHQD